MFPIILICLLSSLLVLIHASTAGADPGFSEGGSESGVYIGGGANPSVVSLK